MQTKLVMVYAPFFSGIGITNAGYRENNSSADQISAMKDAGAKVVKHDNTGRVVFEVPQMFNAPSGVNCQPYNPDMLERPV